MTTILPPPQPDPYGYANSDAATQAIERILAGAAQARKRKFEDSLFAKIMSGASDQELFESVRPEPRAKGFFGGLKEAFSPNAPYRGKSESPLVQLLMSGRLRELGMSSLEKESMAADTRRSNALAKLYESGEYPYRSRTTVNVKPWSTLDQERYQDTIDSEIKAVRESDWGGKDFTQTALLKAWERIKEQTEYDQLPEGKQRALWSRFNSSIERGAKKTDADTLWLGGNEYEWDPKSEAVKAAGPQGGGQQREQGGGRAVTEDELDALIAEFSGNEAAIRRAAAARGLVIPR